MFLIQKRSRRRYEPASLAEMYERMDTRHRRKMFWREVSHALTHVVVWTAIWLALYYGWKLQQLS